MRRLSTAPSVRLARIFALLLAVPAVVIAQSAVKDVGRVARAALDAPLLWGGVRLLPRTPATLEFVPVPRAAHYRMQVSADEAFTTLLADEVLRSPALQVPALSEGDYFIGLRGVDARGAEGRVAVARLRVRLLGEPPKLAAPPAGARIYGSAVTFEWQTDPAAVAHVLELARDATFRTLQGQWTELTQPPFTAEPLPAGEYHWRVTSRLADGRLSLPSESRGLSLRPLPLPMHPPRVELDAIQLAWPSRPGQRFEMQVATDPSFASLLDERRVPEPRLTLARPPAGTYHFRVRATDPDGTVGPWTPARQMQVTQRPPKAACLIEGTDGVCATFAPRDAQVR